MLITTLTQKLMTGMLLKGLFYQVFTDILVLAIPGDGQGTTIIFCADYVHRMQILNSLTILI